MRSTEPPRTPVATNPVPAGGARVRGGERSAGAPRRFESPRRVLERLLDGDPLGLRPRVRERIRERRLLIDPERVFLDSISGMVRSAFRGSARGLPERPSPRRLRRWIDEAIDSALGEDLAAATLPSDRRDATSPWGSGILPAGLPPAAARRACAEFNRLPGETRRCFFDLVLEERSLDELARTSDHSATDLARRARRALQIFLDLTSKEVAR